MERYPISKIYSRFLERAVSSVFAGSFVPFSTRDFSHLDLILDEKSSLTTIDEIILFCFLLIPLKTNLLSGYIIRIFRVHMCLFTD